MTTSPESTTDASAEYDVVVVGAGFGGLSALYLLRERGVRVRLVEAADGVGGTWHRNVYPGARVDIESLEYSFCFSDEIQQEWHWPERYAAQPDVKRYMEFVVDRLGLAPDIQLHSRVVAAHFEPADHRWELTVVDVHRPDAPAERLPARFCVLATGFLSTPNMPRIPGLADFAGTVLHTANWPADPVDLTGDVGVIGTGASGVQVVQSLAPVAGHLKVFQRTPGWCIPLRNEPMPGDYERYVKENYTEIRRLEHEVRGAGTVLMGRQISLPETRKALEVTAEEREADYERRWAAGGIHLGRSFVDLLRDEQANQTLRAFLERKIRDIVKDPDVADKLVPAHPPLSRRPPGEQGYYEAFNQDNVTLVDIRADPITRVVPDGVLLASAALHRLDVLICATGFDAGGGTAKRIDLRGRGGMSLADYWADGVRTHLGMMISGYPNLFLINGPQSPSAHFSPPLLADYQSRHIGRLIELLADHGATEIEPRPDAEAQWINDVAAVYDATLIAKTDSWWMGTNIPGKPRQPVAWAGGFTEYRRRCELAASLELQEYLVS